MPFIILSVHGINSCYIKKVPHYNRIMFYIPAKIHLVFLNKNEAYPPVFRNCIKRIKKMHPRWEVNIYNEDDADRIISKHMPYIKIVYDNYHHLIQKADIFRVILVYLYGGFYLDMDMYCFKPLDDLRRFKLVLGEEKTLTNEVCQKHNLIEKIRVANYMFGSVAEHPFWLVFLQKAVENSLKVISQENDILASTGPGLLSNVYAKNFDQHHDMVLLSNLDRKCLNPMHNEVSCYFGNYAVHLHQGTWRWGNIDNYYLENASDMEEKVTATRFTLEKLIPQVKSGQYSLQIWGTFEKNRDFMFLYESTKRLRNFKFSKKIVLVCGDPTILRNSLSASDVYVLYSAYNETLLLNEWVTCINEHYDSCIVTRYFEKELFINSGVNVPICVVNPGFQRYSRNFFQDLEIPTFNLGFIISGAKGIRYYNEIILASLELASKEIPELNLKIYVDEGCFDESLLISNKIIEINTGFRGYDQFSDWYKSIHCCIYINVNKSFPFTPLESMYLGIPTIIDNSVFNNELLRSGYYATIDFNLDESSKTEGEGMYVGRIKEVILEIYESYDNQQKIASKGALWIEDRWLKEDTEQNLLKILYSIDDA